VDSARLILFCTFRILSFEFVSYFELRISNFQQTKSAVTPYFSFFFFAISLLFSSWKRYIDIQTRYIPTYIHCRCTYNGCRYTPLDITPKTHIASLRTNGYYNIYLQNAQIAQKNMRFQRKNAYFFIKMRVFFAFKSFISPYFLLLKKYPGLEYLFKTTAPAVWRENPRPDLRRRPQFHSDAPGNQNRLSH
jgi:hypothetical protein